MHPPSRPRLPAAAGALRAVAAATCLALPPAAASEPAALDFELPGASGFVRLATLPAQPTLIHFWRADCPPCLREMPLLNAHAASHPGLRVVAIALQTPGETARAPVRPLPPVLALSGPREPRGLLARFGNRAGALPYTVALDAARRPCARRIGEVDEAWLAEAARACARPTILPREEPRA